MNADFNQEVSTVRRIAIVGPECTGKTSLAEALAEYYQTEWVPEYARGYLSKMVRPYTEADLLNIAQGQMRIEDEFFRDAKRVLVCDTNLVVMKIWSEFKFGSCHRWILEEMERRRYDIHLLTNIDVPWEQDPQREHPDKREELYDIYKRQLTTMNVPFIAIKGTTQERQQQAIAAIDRLLTNG